MGVWYATREEVKAALDVKETARNNAAVDRAIESASRGVESLCHRVFYPTVATRYFPWPNYQRARPWRLWLDADELVSVTTLTSGGTVIAASDYFLEPANLGPPYTSIEIDLDSSAAFGGATTFQRSVSVLGVFSGCPADTEPAGTLAAAITDMTGTSVTVSDSASIGVGSLIKVDSERMLVTGKTSLTTGQTVQSVALTASAANESLIVTTGSAFTVGEVVTVDAERMLVVDITSNTLTVKRAWDGSTLAAHNTGVTIYAPRTLTVTRGALGTTAATHLNAAAIVRAAYPGPIRELTIAESVSSLVLERSGYQPSGSGKAATEASLDRSPGLPNLRKMVKSNYGRNIRMRAV